MLSAKTRTASMASKGQKAQNKEEESSRKRMEREMMMVQDG